MKNFLNYLKALAVGVLTGSLMLSVLFGIGYLGYHFASAAVTYYIVRFLCVLFVLMFINKTAELGQEVLNEFKPKKRRK